MESVEITFLARLNSDTVLSNLLGGSNRIRHVNENVLPIQAGTITYSNSSVLPGFVSILTDTELYQFNVYSDNAEAIIKRLRLLLEEYQFSASNDSVIKSCIQEWVGGDEFDMYLQVSVKRVRFRFEICRPAQEPV